MGNAALAAQMLPSVTPMRAALSSVLPLSSTAIMRLFVTYGSQGLSLMVWA